MIDTPGWIQILYARGCASHALKTAFLLNLTNSDVAETAASQPEGRKLLREVALNQLESDNEEVVAQSLLFLRVVGQQEDLCFVERFLVNASDLIQRAARVACYELKQMARG